MTSVRYSKIKYLYIYLDEIDRIEKNRSASPNLINSPVSQIGMRP